MKFHVKHLMLPHKGNSPGARGHKKIEYPAGTKVYAIVYGTLMFHSVYLSEEEAMIATDALITLLAITGVVIATVAMITART